MAAEIIDFSDFGQSIKFSYRKSIYEIPAITNARAIELYKLGKDLREKEPKELADGEKEGSEEGMTIDYFIVFQAKFIAAAILDEHGNKVSEEEVLSWPTKMANKVSKMINAEISGSFESAEEEKKPLTEPENTSK